MPGAAGRILRQAVLRHHGGAPAGELAAVVAQFSAYTGANRPIRKMSGLLTPDVYTGPMEHSETLTKTQARKIANRLVRHGYDSVRIVENLSYLTLSVHYLNSCGVARTIETMRDFVIEFDDVV